MVGLFVANPRAFHFVQAAVGFPLQSLPGLPIKPWVETQIVYFQLNPNSALEIYYSFQLLQIQEFQNNF
jgi:hypothetical protein